MHGSGLGIDDNHKRKTFFAKLENNVWIDHEICGRADLQDFRNRTRDMNR